MATSFRSQLVNRPIANLYNGVSQQPASMRLSSQGELQENGYPNLVDGLAKRPHFAYISSLTSYSAWEDNTLYSAGDIVEDGNLYMTPSGGTSSGTGVADDTGITDWYDLGTPADAFAIHWIDRSPVEQYVVIVFGDPTDSGLGWIEVYDLNGNSITTSLNSKEAYLNTSGTPAREAFAMTTMADFTFIANKTVTCAMDSGTTGGTFKGARQTFADLPSSGVTVGDVWRVEGDPTNGFDDYYVEAVATTPRWVETARPGQTFAFDDSTMPHKLTRTSGALFDFDEVSYTGRAVGDKATNPDPSFVGQTINDVFLYRNRLGFLSGENVILSSVPAADFLFYRDSMVALTDSDPIDFAASDRGQAALNFAVPFNQTLLLFSNKTQFQLNGEPTLTPGNVSLDVTTRFESTTGASPVGAGPNVYFPVPRGDFVGVREYFVEDQVLTNDAADITSHVTNYIPTGLFLLEASSNEDVVLALTNGDPSSVYIYKYFWQGDQKVQASWSRWPMQPLTKLVSLKFYQTDLFGVVARPDGLHLVELELKNRTADTGLQHRVLLDMRVELDEFIYYDVNNETTWQLPYKIDSSEELEIVLTGAWPGQGAKKLDGLTYDYANSRVTAPGDWREHKVFIGFPYTFKYTFSEQFVKDSEGNVIRDARLMMKYMEVNFVDTLYFRAEVTPLNRQTYSYPWTSYTTGGGAVVGQLTPRTDSFKFMVQCPADEATISLVNDQPVPCIFQSAEWRALYVPRSAR